MFTQGDSLIQFNKDNTLKYLALFAVLFIGFIYVLAALHAVNEILAETIAFKDFMSIIAQVAAAGTLIFVVYQYKAMSLKSYDVQIVEEAKSVVVKMNDQIELLVVDDNTNIENLSSFISNMTNLGQDFENYYLEINSNVLKKILRIHWQDMYFNNFKGKVSKVKIQNIFKNDFSGYDPLLLSEAYRETDKNSLFGDYEFCLRLFKNPNMSTKLKKSIGDLSLFKNYYLDDNALNEYMQGLLSRIDGRVVFPLVMTLYNHKNI